MKVGILSLTSGRNFGGTLQAYALFESISSIGYDPVVIDYRPVPPRRESWLNGWGLRNPGRLASIRRKLSWIRHGAGFEQKYDQFKHEHLRWTPQCRNRESMANIVYELDAIVVGSDQVWNQQYHPDPLFQLDGLDGFTGRRISYAACCGNPAQSCPEWTPRAMARFDHVGVRNHFTADWIRKCTEHQINPKVVCDPTLLIDEYPARRLKLPNEYIAAYHIGISSLQDEMRIVRALRSHHGDLPVVCLMPTGVKIHFRSWHDHTLWQLDPFDWVEAVRKATAVYTDSFHAVLFAMKNRVPFVATYAEEVRAPRLIELRDQFVLGDSVIQAGTEPTGHHKPDWHAIEEKMESERRFSSDFLKHALQ